MNKTILIITTSFPEIRNNVRPNHFLYSFTECLKVAGYTPFILMPQKKGMKNTEQQNGITIIRFKSLFLEHTPLFNGRAVYDIRHVGEFFAILIMFFSFIGQIKKAVKDIKPTLVWSNWIQLGYLSSIALGKKVPQITSIQGSDIRNFPHILTKWIAKRIEYNLDMYKGDKEIQGWVKKYGFKDIVVPYPYFDIKKHQFKKKKRKTFVLGVIGRLELDEYHYRHKGIGIYSFEIFKRLVEKNRLIRILVIGDGSARKTFEGIAGKNKDSISFVGWKDDFRGLLSGLDCVIGASGLCGVTLDVVPSGVATLVSKYDPALGFWKNKKNCLIYDPDDLVSFSLTLEQAFKKRDLLKKIAHQAKKDLQEYAMPMDKAGKVWSDKLDEFIILWKKRFSS
jgi:glycosyltransferase involved in cell wall biosynthesis